MSRPETRILPRALREVFSPPELTRDEWCDGIRALGSYWPRSDDLDLQSRLVKYFKELSPKPLEKSCMLAITRAYGIMLAEAARDWQPDAIVRVLASAETRPDPLRPHSLLVQAVSETLAVPDFTHLFFRTEPRKPMRMVGRLGGPEVLRQRISYVLQDLFVTPARIGGTVLVIDDIHNLGATARVYAAALKRLCGAQCVCSVNIAAARFSGGKDGWGYLALDIDRFISLARQHIGFRDPADAFEDAWIERGRVEFHLDPDCPRMAGRPHRSLRFLAGLDRSPCPSCAAPDPRSALRNWIGGRFRS